VKPTFTISKDKCSITCLKCGRTILSKGVDKIWGCGRIQVK